MGTEGRGVNIPSSRFRLPTLPVSFFPRLHQSTTRQNQRTIFKRYGRWYSPFHQQSRIRKELKTMSAQKTLSQLSFAAIALVIAAIPCFAQTDSATTPTEIASNQIAANYARRTSSRPESVVVAEAKVDQKQTTFSATKFMHAVSAPASFQTNANSSTPTIVLNDPNDLDATKLAVDKPAVTKRITFVPSKGQRIPQ